MKKIPSHKLKIVAALLLACVMITGIEATYALFSDKDAKESVMANMATVDIELQSQSFTQSNGTASFTVINNSNISIYLRAGIIFELLTISGEPAIADTNGISITGPSTGWEAERKALTDGSNTYTKWFLTYGDGMDYTEVNPNENPMAEFTVSGIPDGYTLIVNVVPEAVQVDMDSKALKDFKNSSNISPAW